MSAKGYTGDNLTDAVKNGTASRGMRREYINRVERKGSSPACIHGHARCAIRQGGPCIWDVESTITDDNRRPKA